ncbi:MAG: hypothetical protein ACKN9P_00590, partial [Phenylobacterium sp.]
MGDIAVTTIPRPAVRPARPEFSSGPCAKRPGWTPEALKDAVLGRSHRSKPGKARLQEAITRTRRVLQVPDSHLIGIVPGSDTGAVEMALWSLLGPRKVQMLAFESFGKDWVTDVVKQLKLPAEVLEAPYGALPDLSRVDPEADLVFTWNGTTSGVRVPDAGFISADRGGLAICDATSAAFEQVQGHLAVLGHAEQLGHGPGRGVALQPLDGAGRQHQHAVRAFAAEGLLPGEGHHIEPGEVERLRESRGCGVADRNPATVSRDPPGIRYPHARGG